MMSYVDAICPMEAPSRTYESAFGAFVLYTLVTALGAPSDLFVAAVGALEEGVPAALKPDTA